MNRLEFLKIASALVGGLIALVSLSSMAGEVRYWTDSYGNYVTDASGNCIRSTNWTAEYTAETYVEGCDPAPKVAEIVEEAVVAKFEPTPVLKALSLDVSARFSVGSSKLDDSADQAIEELSRQLAKFQSIESIEVAGYTDNSGSEENNQKLSKMRAEAVKDLLVTKYGVDPEVVKARGYGSSDPVGNNSTKAGREQNRRAEIIVSGKVLE